MHAVPFSCDAPQFSEHTRKNKFLPACLPSSITGYDEYLNMHTGAGRNHAPVCTSLQIIACLIHDPAQVPS